MLNYDTCVLGGILRANFVDIYVFDRTLSRKLADIRMVDRLLSAYFFSAMCVKPHLIEVGVKG